MMITYMVIGNNNIYRHRESLRISMLILLVLFFLSYAVATNNLPTFDNSFYIGQWTV